MKLDRLPAIMIGVLVVLGATMAWLVWAEWSTFEYRNEISLQTLVTVWTTVLVSVVIANSVTRASETRRIVRESSLPVLVAIERLVERATERYASSVAKPISRSEGQAILADLKAAGVLVREMEENLLEERQRKECRAIGTAIRLIRTSLSKQPEFPSDNFSADPVQLALTHRDHAQFMLAVVRLKTGI